jgi:N6-adenosine-specific RNA methylase IME4
MNNPFPNKKYKTIYCDPAWNEVGGGKIKRGADRHYTLMKTKDIKKLPVQSIADDDCWLFMWVTNNFLKDGLDVMEYWGFRYVTNLA